MFKLLPAGNLGGISKFILQKFGKKQETALDIATGKSYSAITQLLKDRAEGRKLVYLISQPDLNTVSESGKF